MSSNDDEKSSGKKKFDPQLAELKVTNSVLWNLLIQQSLINLTVVQALKAVVAGDLARADVFADEVFDRDRNMATDRDALIYGGEDD